MCLQIIRACGYCSYRRHGWWEQCGQYCDMYRDAIDPFVAPHERPCKPKEQDCMYRGVNSRALSLGGCENAACPAKPIHKLLMAERKSSEEKAQKLKEYRADCFIRAYCKKIPVLPIKKAINNVFEPTHNLLEWQQEEEVPRPIVHQNSAEAHEEAREALRQMMQTANMEDAAAFDSESDSESDISEPPVIKRHVRGGYMMQREAARRPITRIQPAAINVKQKATGIIIPSATPTTATDTTSAPKHAELSAPKDGILTATMSQLSLASATSTEVTPIKPGNNTLLQSPVSGASPASSEGADDFVEDGGEQQRPSTPLSPCQAKGQRARLVQPPPGFGFEDGRAIVVEHTVIGIDAAIDQAESVSTRTLGRAPIFQLSRAGTQASETLLIDKAATDEPTSESRQYATLRAGRHYDGTINKNHNALLDTSFYKPRLPETRPRFWRLTAQDQLRGFFGRDGLEREPGSDEPCRLYAEFPLVFGYYTPWGFELSKYEMAVVPRGLGFSQPKCAQVPVDTENPLPNWKVVEAEKPLQEPEQGNINMHGIPVREICERPPTPQISKVHESRARTECYKRKKAARLSLETEEHDAGSQCGDDTALGQIRDGVKTIIPPPGLGFKTPRVTEVETTVNDHKRVKLNSPCRETALERPRANSASTDGSFENVSQPEGKLVMPPPGLGFQEARFLPASLRSTRVQDSGSELTLVASVPDAGQESLLNCIKPTDISRSNLRMIAPPPGFSFKGMGVIPRDSSWTPLPIGAMACRSQDWHDCVTGELCKAGREARCKIQSPYRRHAQELLGECLLRPAGALHC